MSVFTKSSCVQGNLNPLGQTPKPVKELGLFFRCHMELKIKSESPFLISLFNSKITQFFSIIVGILASIFSFSPASLSG